MQKRRERIEQWRAERKPKAEDVTPVQILPSSKNWTLEDEDEDEEKGGTVETADAAEAEAADADGMETRNGDAAEEDDDIDPLDAYMQVWVLHSK